MPCYTHKMAILSYSVTSLHPMYYVCVRVSVREHISGTTVKFSPNFVHIWPWLAPPLTALRYVMYFRFVVRHVRSQWPRIDDAKRRIPVLKWLSRGQKGFDNAAYTQADCTGQHRIGAEFDIGLCDCCVSREVAVKCLKQVQLLFKNAQGHKRMISQYHVKIRYTASSERIRSPAQTDSKSSELRWPNVATLHLWFRPNSHPLSLNIRPNCPFW